MLVSLGQNPNHLLWDNPRALFLVRGDSVVLSLVGSSMISFIKLSARGSSVVLNRIEVLH